MFGRPQLVLKCIAPEGSPMQHRMFTLDVTGATIGRKQTNLVSLSQEKGTFSRHTHIYIERGLLRSSSQERGAFQR